MFVKEMKLLIKYGIELDISGLECKVGYKGDALLKFSSSEQDTIQKIEAFCSKADIEYKISYNQAKATTDIYKHSFQHSSGGANMLLKWALVFLAAIFGFGGVASTATTIAKVLFVILLVLFIISLFF